MKFMILTKEIGEIMNNIMNKQDRSNLDKLWQKAIAFKYYNRCAITGDPVYNGAHHIIPRIHTIYRWDIDNGIMLSPDVHRDVEDNPKKFLDWMEEFYPTKHQWYVVNNESKYNRNEKDKVDEDISRLQEYCREHSLYNDD